MAIRTFKNKFGTGWVEVKNNLYNMTTEEWGSTRPIIDQVKCKFCGICYIICPTGCIALVDDHFEATLQYCKGCGLCSYECPAKAISMK